MYYDDDIDYDIVLPLDGLEGDRTGVLIRKKLAAVSSCVIDGCCLALKPVVLASTKKLLLTMSLLRTS